MVFYKWERNSYTTSHSFSGKSKALFVSAQIVLIVGKDYNNQQHFLLVLIQYMDWVKFETMAYNLKQTW